MAVNLSTLMGIFTQTNAEQVVVVVNAEDKVLEEGLTDDHPVRGEAAIVESDVQLTVLVLLREQTLGWHRVVLSIKLDLEGWYCHQGIVTQELRALDVACLAALAKIGRIAPPAMISCRGQERACKILVLSLEVCAKYDSVWAFVDRHEGCWGSEVLSTIEFEAIQLKAHSL